MMLPKGTTVAVADGEKLNLFMNTGEGGSVVLTALPHQLIDQDVGASSGGHQSSSSNPNESQVGEDGFSAGVVRYLNQQALSGSLDGLLVIAAPRALGEMRKHYHKALSSILRGELSKDLTGHSLADVERAIAAA